MDVPCQQLLGPESSTWTPRGSPTAGLEDRAPLCPSRPSHGRTETEGTCSQQGRLLPPPPSWSTATASPAHGLRAWRGCPAQGRRAWGVWPTSGGLLISQRTGLSCTSLAPDPSDPPVPDPLHPEETQEFWEPPVQARGRQPPRLRRRRHAYCLISRPSSSGRHSAQGLRTVREPHRPTAPFPPPLGAASPAHGPRPANCAVAPQTSEKAEEVTTTHAPPGSPAEDPSFSCSHSTHIPRTPLPRASPPSSSCPAQFAGAPTGATCPVPGPQSVPCLEHHHSKEGCWPCLPADQQAWSTRGVHPVSSSPTLLDGLAHMETSQRQRAGVGSGRPRARSRTAGSAPAPPAFCRHRHVHGRPEAATGEAVRSRSSLQRARDLSRKETPQAWAASDPGGGEAKAPHGSRAWMEGLPPGGSGEGPLTPRHVELHSLSPKVLTAHTGAASLHSAHSLRLGVGGSLLPGAGSCSRGTAITSSHLQGRGQRPRGFHGDFVWAQRGQGATWASHTLFCTDCPPSASVLGAAGGWTGQDYAARTRLWTLPPAPCLVLLQPCLPSPSVAAPISATV